MVIVSCCSWLIPPSSSSTSRKVSRDMIVFLYASHSSQQSTSQFSNTCRHLSATAHKFINIVLKGSDDMWQRSMHLIIKFVPSLRICKRIDMQRGWYAMCLDEVDVLLIFFTGQWKQWRSTRSGPVSPPSLRGGRCLTTQVTPDSFFFYLFIYFLPAIWDKPQVKPPLKIYADISKRQL